MECGGFEMSLAMSREAHFGIGILWIGGVPGVGWLERRRWGKGGGNVFARGGFC